MVMKSPLFSRRRPSRGEHPLLLKAANTARPRGLLAGVELVHPPDGENWTLPDKAPLMTQRGLVLGPLSPPNYSFLVRGDSLPNFQ